MRIDWLPPELPQLATLLDPAEMERIISARSRISALRLERIRYRPQRNCLITWSASVESVDGPHRTFLSILACRNGESGRHLEQTAALNTAKMTRAAALPELDAVLWIFPQDRKLRGIAALDDPTALLADLAVEIEGIAPQKSLDVVHFVAERACTARVKLRDEAGWAYGKFYRPGESARSWELMNRLWMSESCQSGQLIIPAPLAHHPATASVWLQGLVGEPLDQGATDGQLFETGRRLASLHATPREGLLEITGTELAAQLRRAIETILLVRPDLRERLAALSRSLGTIGMGSPGTLHGDLHLKNIFGLGDGRIALI
ncbi:MAG: phosphotransferase, partial [Acidobacteriota bacterium]